MKRSRLAASFAFCAIALLSACVKPGATPDPTPAMRWDHRPEALNWTKATLGALDTDGAVLATTVPSDISTFCPGYADATLEEREAFWAGLLSALAKYESTWNPTVTGGGGRWVGLLQIAPGTAAANKCDAASASGLRDGAQNLECGVKIAARSVGRDGAIAVDGNGNWAGLARDWAPMRSAAKRSEMAAWTRAQSYCQPG